MVNAHSIFSFYTGPLIVILAYVIRKGISVDKPTAQELEIKFDYLAKALGYPPLAEFELDYKTRRAVSLNGETIKRTQRPIVTQYPEYVCLDSFGNLVWPDKSAFLLLFKAVLQHLNLPGEDIHISVTVDDRQFAPASSGIAGQYTGGGNFQLNLRKEFVLYNIVAIICYECTCHFLSGKNIGIQLQKENEILTDIAAVYLGFGKYLKMGYRPIVRENSVFKKVTTIGGLTVNEIKYIRKKAEKLRREKADK